MHMKAPFMLEELDIRPNWSQIWIGRLIYVSQDNQIYIGGKTSWIGLGLMPNSINLDMLNLGYKNNQIHGGVIPFQDPNGYMEVTNVSDAIIQLSVGAGFGEKVIERQTIADQAINIEKLLLDLTETGLSSKTLPIECNWINGDSYLQDWINMVELNSVRKIVKTVHQSEWIVSPTNSFYTIEISTSPIRTRNKVVMCFDNEGNIRQMENITLKETAVFLRSYHPYLLNVVIIG